MRAMQTLVSLVRRWLAQQAPMQWSGAGGGSSRSVRCVPRVS